MSGMTGKHHSEETKAKLRQANLGNKNMLGHHHSEETRKKIGLAGLGRKDSPETREKKHLAGLNYKNSLGCKLTMETRKKMSLSRKGEGNPLWKGGITPLLPAIRGSFEFRLWKSDVLHRDNFTCQKCGAHGVILHAHHKKAFRTIVKEYKINTMDQAKACAELWDLNNGQTLCGKCHRNLKEKRS